MLINYYFCTITVKTRNKMKRFLFFATIACIACTACTTTQPKDILPNMTVGTSVKEGKQSQTSKEALKAVEQFVKTSSKTKDVVWEEKLIDVIKNNPGTLSCSEKKMEQLLGKNFSVKSSDDGNLRIYSWATDRGGSNVLFGQFIQYRTKGGKVLVEFAPESLDKGTEDSDQNPDSRMWESGNMVMGIYSLDAPGKKVYLVKSYNIYSHGMGYQYVDAMLIEGDNLKEAPIFISEGKKQSCYQVECYGELIDDDRVIKYDSQNKILHCYYVWDESKSHYIISYPIEDVDIKLKFDGKLFNEVK